MKKILIVLCLLYSSSLFSITTENSNSSNIDLYKAVTSNSSIQVVKENIKAVRFEYGSDKIVGSVTVRIIKNEEQLLVDYGDFFYATVYDSDRNNYRYCFKLSGFMFYFNL